MTQSNRAKMIAAVTATGSHFFDKSVMNQFGSIVEHRDVIPVDPPRTWVFVSSELYGGDGPRRWKVRTVNLDPPEGWQEKHPDSTWRSVVNTPDRLNPHAEGFTSRDAAFAVAAEHALVWHDSRRDGSAPST